MEIPKEHKSEFRPEHWTGKHCNWRFCQRLDENYKKVVHMFMFAVDMLQCEGRCWRMSGNLSNLGARAAAPASNKDSPCNLMLLWLPSWGWHKERAYYTARPLISSQPWRGNCHPQRSRGQIEASTGAGQGENEEGFCCLRTDLWCFLLNTFHTSWKVSGAAENPDCCKVRHELWQHTCFWRIGLVVAAGLASGA